MPLTMKKKIYRYKGGDPVDTLASGISYLAKSLGKMKPSKTTNDLINKYRKGGSHQYTYYPETQASNNISASRRSKMIKDFGAILDRPAIILPYGFNARK